MVAEVEQAPAKERPANYLIPLDVKLKVRNLYLFRSASYAEISKQTKLTVRQVTDLIQREGLVAEKRKLEQVQTESHDARAKAAQDAAVEAIAGQAEEIALSGLNRARDAVTRKGKDAAKNFQSWTGGIRNLVSAIKTIRGGVVVDGAGTTNLNLFFMSAPRPGETKPAEKIADKVSEPIDVK